MIPYTALTYINLGFLKIPTYGVIVAVAFLLCGWLTARKAEKTGASKEVVWDLFFWLLIGAIVGMRIGYVVINLDYFLSEPLEILKIWNGGAVFFGGLFGAFLSAGLYLKLKKIDFWRYANLFAPYIFLGHAIGRIGCFVVPDDYGIASTLPWAMDFGDGILRHPTQLYLVFANLGAFFALRKIKKNTFAWYLIFYSVLRFLMDFIRYFPEGRIYGLSVGQLIAVPMFIAGLVLLWKKK